MNRAFKWVVMVTIAAVLGALVSSCSTSRQLGCPMKITAVPAAPPSVA